jgi:DNA ligase-associated metallophosphoesterase
MTKSLRIEHGGHSLELLGSGAIRWESTLLVADLHLGKETVFQKSGIAIPSGATQRTLDRLEGLVRDWEGVCDRVVVLGDLLHAPTGWTEELEVAFKGLMDRHRSLQWKLVAGNHDRRSHGRLREIGWEVLEGSSVEGAMRWIHDPSEVEGMEDRTGALGTTLAGHLHPCYRVPVDARRTVRAACFWIGRELIVLPAFGGWVGAHAIEPKRGDRIVVCVEGELIECKHFGK